MGVFVAALIRRLFDKTNPDFELLASTPDTWVPSLDIAFKNTTNYYYDPRYLPTLARVYGSRRKPRVDGCWSMVLVIRSLLLYLDLATMRVGYPSPDGFRPPKLTDIAGVTGLSMDQIWRSVTKLKRIGAIKIHRRSLEKADGSIVGLAAVRSVTPAFLRALGVSGNRLKKDREIASKRLEKLARSWGTTVRAVASLAMLGFGGENRPKPKQKSDDGREKARQMLELTQRYPGKTNVEILNMLNRRN